MENAMTILGWDLLVVPMMMGTAVLLMMAAVVGLRTHRAGAEKPPEGTVVGLMILAVLAAVVTLVVLVVMKADLIVADLRATMATETATRTHRATPEDTTMPRIPGILVRVTPQAGREKAVANLEGAVTSD